MSTLAPRLSITMPLEISTLLNQRAKNEKTSISRVALNFIISAVERDEDIYFSRLAEKRDVPSAKRVSHEDAWK